MKGAFNADPAAKAAALARLEGRIARGELAHDTALHGDDAASWAGELAGSADLARLPDACGIPAALGLLVDNLLLPLGQAGEERETMALALAQAIVVGSDLAPVCAQMALAMLDDPRLAPRLPADLATPLRALHHRHNNGETVVRGEWAALRNAAIAAGDALAPTDFAKGALRVIETAAWPMAGSRAGLTDLFWACQQVLSSLAVQDSGWTAQDEARANATLEAIAAEHAAQEAAGEMINYPALFAAREPVLEERYRARFGVLAAASLDWARKVAGWLEAALAAARPALIPLAALFGLPRRFSTALSPSGQWLAWLAPVDGVANIWVAPSDRPEDARPVTAQTVRGIAGFTWAGDDRTVLFSQDGDGNELFHLHGVDRETAQVRDLTPFAGAQCGLAGTSPRHPGVVLATSNARNPHFPDLLRIDLASGAHAVIEENDRFAGFLCDAELRPVIARQALPDGSHLLFRKADGQWHELLRIAAEDARVSGPAGLSADGTTLFLLDSAGRDTSALFALDLASGTRTLLAQDDRADIAGFLADADSWRPLCAYATYLRTQRQVIDAAITPTLAFLDEHLGPDWALTSRTTDDTRWTLGVNSDTSPGQAWLFDRTAQTLTLLYETRPELADAALMPMHATIIPARDGLAMASYLTLPAQAAVTSLDDRPRVAPPMVLLVHGGPWARDSFGYNPQTQWLANRGYAVLAVNFRGSTGFGKHHLAAGNGEWGGRMAQDLDDAVEWAIAHGFADPARIAIMGGSYGGYATLRAMTTRPERYACGVDIVGPANLETLMAAIPPWWESERAFLYNAVGNPDTEQGLATLRAHSPVHQASAIVRPLLIGQGANDPRVRQDEADQIAAALAANGVTPNYALFPDEGHGFARPANDMAFKCVIEAFLAAHLGGHTAPPAPADIAGHTMQVVSGEPWLLALAKTM